MGVSSSPSPSPPHPITHHPPKPLPLPTNIRFTNPSYQLSPCKMLNIPYFPLPFPASAGGGEKRTKKRKEGKKGVQGVRQQQQQQQTTKHRDHQQQDLSQGVIPKEPGSTSRGFVPSLCTMYHV
eukprot:Sspe_Gene.72918::Locus_43722_Transcript_1_1_Confidence_1.000_Length_616::g.72918::m.72918